MRSTSLHVTIVCITIVDSDWWILIFHSSGEKLYAIYNSSDFIVTRTIIHLIITLPTTMNYKSILKQGNKYLESLTTLFSLISSISRWALHQVNETNNIREIKHRVYGKRERQKYHAIASLPPFFTFAVCRFQREEACSRVHQQREYFFKVFYSFCYNFQPVFKPTDVLFIFLRKLTGLLSVFTQKGRKKCAGK